MKKLFLISFCLISYFSFSQKPAIKVDDQGNATIGNNLTVTGSLIANIESQFASMSVSSGSATLIDGATTWHAYIDGSAGELSANWTFSAGVRTDLSGATFATAGGGSETQITVVTHNLSLNDYVTLSGSSTAGYNTTASTVHQVTAVASSTDFTLDVAFIDDPATEGFVSRADQLVAGANAAGKYIVQCSASGFISTGSATCQFGVFKNGTLEAKRDRKFQNASDRGAWNFSNGRIITIIENDVVWNGILNEDNSNDVTIGDQDFSIHKL